MDYFIYRIILLVVFYFIIIKEMHNSMHLTAKNSFKQTEMTTNTKNQDKFVD